MYLQKHLETKPHPHGLRVGGTTRKCQDGLSLWTWQHGSPVTSPTLQSLSGQAFLLQSVPFSVFLSRRYRRLLLLLSVAYANQSGFPPE